MPGYNSLNTNTIGGLMGFLANPQTSPQRTNRFKVSFFGKGIQDIIPLTGGSDGAVFFATMVQIPSRGIMFYPDSVGPWTPYWRSPLKTTFDDKFLVEFFVDEKFTIRKFIENWMDKILNSSDGVLIKDDVCSNTTMTIQPIDSINNSNTTITLDYVWPKLILPSEFNTDRPELLRMQVDFSYRTAKFS